jgi:hypothetical protein
MDFDVYQPRNPKASSYYRCVEDHFEQLETVWDDRYQSRFGFWRSYVTDVIRRYLDCGNLHFGKITNSIIENMLNWRHSGFNVYCGKAIWPHNEEGLENLARYIIRASFSQERMTYVAANDSSDRAAKVIYQSKDGKTTKTFDALDWLAQLVTHIPNKGEQPVESLKVERMVRYYGFYSNKSRGLRKKAGTDGEVPALIDSDISRKAFLKNWARLIQKIYNVNPLLCPKCLGSMRIISLIDDAEIIKKILKHLDLWDVKRKPPPCANGPPTEAIIIYDQSPVPSTDNYIIDADRTTLSFDSEALERRLSTGYPIETYL